MTYKTVVCPICQNRNRVYVEEGKVEDFSVREKDGVFLCFYNEHDDCVAKYEAMSKVEQMLLRRILPLERHVAGEEES